MTDATDPMQEETPAAETPLTKEQRFAALDRMRLEQSIPGALLGGLTAAAVGAIIWAIITHLTHFQIGFMAITGEDEAFLVPSHVASKVGAPTRLFVLGDSVRDWSIQPGDQVEFPYVQSAIGFQPAPYAVGSAYDRWSWRNRVFLRSRVMFGKTAEQHGFRWDQYMQFIKDRVDSAFLIAFAFVATHNHFVLNRGGKVFNRSAPVIKLPTGASEDEHLGLLGLLNSSLACFWMKQVFHNKGSTVDIKGARQRTDAFEDFYEYTGTGLAGFPIVEACPHDIATRIDNAEGQLVPQAAVWQMSHSDLKAVHGFADDRKLRPVTHTERLEVKGNSFVFTFPRTSLTILKLTVR